MATIEKLSIALPHDMAEAVREAVQAGEYATTSEVIRDALRGWRLKRRIEELNTMDLRRLVQEGIASLDRGERIPAEQVFRRLTAKYSAMAKKKNR